MEVDVVALHVLGPITLRCESRLPSPLQSGLPYRSIDASYSLRGLSLHKLLDIDLLRIRAASLGFVQSIGRLIGRIA